MEEWKEYKLGEIISLVIDYRGKTPKKLGGDWSSSGYRAISAKNIKTGKIVQEESIRFVNEKLYQLWMKDEIQKEDILITSEAPFGQVYFWNSEEKIVLSQRLFALRIKETLSPKYVYYYMTTNSFQKELDGRATGTTVTGLRQPELMKCKISVPPLPTQQKIAAILSSLDDKIELNNKINTNLEQQAQALFKNWFVDFEPFGGKMPKGWKVGKLSDIAEITMGQSPDGKSYNEEGIGTVFYQGRAEFGTRFPTRRLFTTEPKRIAKKFDTLMSVRAPVGDLNIANEDCCIGRGLAAIHSKDRHQSFIYYTALSLRPQLDVFNGEGTVFGCINRDALNNMEIVIPAKNELDKFEQIVATMDADIFNRSEENSRLESIRDTLLPKLMNGEIEV